MSKLNATLYCIYEFKIIGLPIVYTKLSIKNSLEGKKQKRKKKKKEFGASRPVAHWNQTTLK